MKRNCLNRWINSRSFFGSVLLILPILFWVTPARGSADLDRRYALETIGFLKAWDNVDGLFEGYVEEAYKEYFKNKSRFTLEDITRGNDILSRSKLPYREIIEDDKILGRLVRKFKVESVIRTRAYKEGPQYRFVIEWLHSPKMDVLAKHSFYFEEPPKGSVFGIEKLKNDLHVALDEMIAKVPFKGHVTGRDEKWVTVNLGESSGVNAGDTLTIESLEVVKKHPLLNSIVSWEFVPVGRLLVDSAEANIAFCVIVEEAPGRRISRFQKITKHIPKRVEARAAEVATETMTKPVDQTPRLGFVGFGALLGSLTRSYNGATTKEGNGILFGAKGEGQLWLTRKLMAELGINYGFHGYSQEDITSGSGTGTEEGGTGGNYFKIQASLGYRFFLNDDDWGPQGYARLGYRSISYNLVDQSAILLGPSTFTSLFIGIGGDLPIRGRFGAQLMMDLGLIKSVTETGFSSGGSTGVFDISFYVGGYYKMAPNMIIRVGFDIQANKADFGSSASFSHRVLTFNPQLLYYF